ncbi:MAG: PVC-type heme-binding CxxCH protein, partial [Planctomycetota bacterium]
MLDNSRLNRSRMVRPWALIVAGLLAVVTPLSDRFDVQVAAGPPVAPTEALTPDEERQKFRLPPGFEIQLVASEPDIQKPMNLAFDAQGRLWVTHSVEYPFAVTDGQTPRDGITLLSDFAANGRAQKISKFATDLHIPIGVLPLGDGHEAIAWSIPHLWKLTDTDRDGKLDRREVLYGPFDYADTHGNQNALRLGPDGWVYACHGFRNNSQVKLRGDGPVVLTMQSGNSYRFRPDGSAIEQLTWGQVNPFGMCFDRWGDRYSADCHSKALTLLLRGGYYESFGKPHDGLGYAPPMTVHGHDSTGIAGVVHYDATHFPASYRHCFYVGNVVTNVVHRDVVSWRGSSPWVEKPEDFVACDDPWFHPVDLQMGPDGALYIADFYNSIIGHYEVDLKHPRRDRTRGRIWRVVWKGENAQPAAIPNFTQLTPPQLVERLSDENQTVRTLATQQLLEREPAAAIEAVTKGKLSPLAQSHAAWILARQGQLSGLVRALGPGRAAPTTTPPATPGTPGTPAENEQATEESQAGGDGVVRAAVLRALAEQPRLEAWASAWLREQLAADQPRVRRLAAETMARHPAAEQIAPLLA